MILHSLLKNGQYFSKESLEYKTDKVKEYDKQKAEQIYNEWLKRKNETEIKGGTGAKYRTEDKKDTEVNDETEVKQEPDEFQSEHENSIALNRDYDINERIDLHIAIFESNEILRKKLGVEESISILNNYFASQNVTTVDKSDQVTEATKYILEKYNVVSTGRPQISPPEASNDGFVVDDASMNHGSHLEHQSKNLIGLSNAIPIDSIEERLSLQDAIPNTSIKSYSWDQEVYTQKDKSYTTDNNTVCIFKNASNGNFDYLSTNQAHSKEINREHEVRPCKYRKVESMTSSQNLKDKKVCDPQGTNELPHQQQYKLFLSNDTEDNSCNTHNCDSKGTYQLPRIQSATTNDKTPESDANLPETLIPELPKLLPLEDYVDDDEVEGETEQEVEEHTEEVVRRSSYDYIPDIKALAEDATLRMHGNSKRSNRKYRFIKNWEFLMRLLADPRSNPQLIRWENREQYTFRLAQEDIITDIWNSKSERKPVTYNNFARGLRYHYKTGMIIPVRERQLVYGCGPDAIEFLHKLLRNQAETNETNSMFFRPWN